jgi:hypothetical protein
LTWSSARQDVVADARQFVGIAEPRPSRDQSGFFGRGTTRGLGRHAASLPSNALRCGGLPVPPAG